MEDGLGLRHRPRHAGAGYVWTAAAAAAQQLCDGEVNHWPSETGECSLGGRAKKDLMLSAEEKRAEVKNNKKSRRE